MDREENTPNYATQYVYMGKHVGSRPILKVIGEFHDH